jgi:GNAT superfamily N-acetyltransferase
MTEDLQPLPTSGPAGYSILMVRDHLDHLPDWPFPEGFGMRPIQPGEEAVWIDIQRDAEPYFDTADDLFDREFGYDPQAAWERVFFVTDPDGNPVGTMGAWYDRAFRGENYGRIHWVSTRRAFQGLGLARASLAGALRFLARHHPKAYLSTQTKRLPAIAIYLDAGFLPDITTETDRIAWAQTASGMRNPEHRDRITKTLEVGS